MNKQQKIMVDDLWQKLDTAERMHAPEKSLGVKVDKTLIKQFARRIYGTIKESIIIEREKVDKILIQLYGDTSDKGD